MNSTQNVKSLIQIKFVRAGVFTIAAEGSLRGTQPKNTKQFSGVSA
jgi:hypothetical protein